MTIPREELVIDKGAVARWPAYARQMCRKYIAEVERLQAEVARLKSAEREGFAPGGVEET